MGSAGGCKVNEGYVKVGSLMCLLSSLMEEGMNSLVERGENLMVKVGHIVELGTVEDSEEFHYQAVLH